MKSNSFCLAFQHKPLFMISFKLTTPTEQMQQYFWRRVFRRQVAMQANVPQPSNDEDETDDVDEDLKKLQISLEGGSGGGGWGDVTEDPSISDYLQYYK